MSAPGSPERTSRALPAAARERLAARARQIARIRRGVIAATLAAFVLAWCVIAATGSMGATTTTTAQSAPTTSSTDSGSSSSSSTGQSSDAITTSQS